MDWNREVNMSKSSLGLNTYLYLSANTNTSKYLYLYLNPEIFKVFVFVFESKYLHLCKYFSNTMQILFIPPQTKFRGVYWFHPVRPSVRRSVRLSVCRRSRVRSVAHSLFDETF